MSAYIHKRKCSNSYSFKKITNKLYVEYFSKIKNEHDYVGLFNSKVQARHKGEW